MNFSSMNSKNLRKSVECELIQYTGRKNAYCVLCADEMNSKKVINYFIFYSKVLIF